MTLKQLTDKTRDILSKHYSTGEATALTREIFLRLKGYTPVDLVTKADIEVSEYLAEKVDKITERLLLDEPIQYIFGISRFYGMDFKVTPEVLIPRPETAELVDLIVKEHNGKQDLRILDLCSGSGAIAIALSRNLAFSLVRGIEISPKAIEISRENAKLLKASVDFQIGNVLDLPSPSRPEYDIIVSNPPYITENEKGSVDPNVILYEPHTALFVENGNPLKFYKAIEKYALKALNPGGYLYFEINPNFSEQLRKELTGEGWMDIDILRDSDGKERFAKAIKSK